MNTSCEWCGALTSNKIGVTCGKRQIGRHGDGDTFPYQVEAKYFCNYHHAFQHAAGVHWTAPSMPTVESLAADAEWREEKAVEPWNPQEWRVRLQSTIHFVRDHSQPLPGRPCVRLNKNGVWTKLRPRRELLFRKVLYGSRLIKIENRQFSVGLN